MRQYKVSVNPAKSFSFIAIVNEVINYDVHRVDGVDKNTTRVRKLLESYARNISTMAANETIMADVRATDQTISPNTFAIYLSALRRIFIVDDVPAWSPALRSRTKIRTSPKRHFVDPSIAVALMGTNPRGLRERIRKNKTIIKDREFQSHFKKSKFKTEPKVGF